MFRMPIVTVAMVCALSMLTGCAQVQSMGLADPLIQALTGQLNVTANQASGGLGAILSLAKQKLGAMDFSALTKLLPQSDSYIQAAKSLGAVTGPVTDQAGLQSSFSRLGMGSDMVGKFTGVLSDYLGKAGGEPAKNLLAAVLR